MVHTTWRVFLYALVAATSPLALTSTLVVLRSGRGRVNGTLYAAAFVFAQTSVLVLALALGVVSITESGGAESTMQAVFALVVGVALIVVAFYLRRRPLTRTPHPDATHSGSGRAAAVFGRIKQIRPVHAITGGIALGIGGPKRLTVTVLAAGTIAAGGLPAGETASVATMYIAVGTLLVWLPVVLYVIAGNRAEDWIAAAQHWASAHERDLTFYPALVVGLILVADAIVQLCF